MGPPRAGLRELAEIGKSRKLTGSSWYQKVHDSWGFNSVYSNQNFVNVWEYQSSKSLNPRVPTFAQQILQIAQAASSRI